MFSIIRQASGFRRSIYAGSLVFIITVLVAVVISNVYAETQARNLVDAMAPSLRTLCFAVITAAATITSLILTTVGFIHRIEDEFDDAFYYRIKIIAFECAIVLILGVLVLLILTVPITESDILRSWFSAVYYGLIFCSALISSLIVAIILLLYTTISDVIHTVGPFDY